MNKTVMMLLILNMLLIGSVVNSCILTQTQHFDDRQIHKLDTVYLYFGDRTPYIYDIFLFGKVSNVRRGGYTPAYWFHMDKVMTIGKQNPKIQWLEDCNAHMLSMDFYGFVFKNIIIGWTLELLLY